MWGYNGLLVGMVFATFLSRGDGDSDSFDAAVILASVLLGGLSTVLNLALGNALVPTFKSPPFTLAFNTTMLIFLLASEHFSHVAMPHHLQDHDAAAAPVAATTAATAVDVPWLLWSSLVAVGQVRPRPSHTRSQRVRPSR